MIKLKSASSYPNAEKRYLSEVGERCDELSGFIKKYLELGIEE